MILALDLGSTNFKAALFNGSLERLGEHAIPTPYSHNDGTRVEMDADEVRAVSVELIRDTCRAAGVATTTIGSIAITSQAQNCVVLDEAGQARTPVTSWLDGRAGAEAAELWEALGGEWHQHCSFNSLTGQMQLAHLLWMRRHMPEAFEGNISVMTLPGLLFHMLTGLNLTDTNLAAMSGAYSLQSHAWRPELQSRCGIGADQMPRVVPIGTTVTAAPRCPGLELGAEIVLVPAGNDQTAGAYGNGCREGDIVATLGTALVAYRHAGDTPGPYSDGGCWGPFPGGGYYELAVIDAGCLALEWAREVLMPGADIKAFDTAVAKALPAASQITGRFNPRAMRTPDAWQGDFRSTGEKAYAVLAGLARELRRLVRDELGCDEAITLRAIGGGSHSDVWLQIIADVMGCPVSAGTGDSLLGAAAMGIASPNSTVAQHR